MYFPWLIFQWQPCICYLLLPNTIWHATIKPLICYTLITNHIAPSANIWWPIVNKYFWALSICKVLCLELPRVKRSNSQGFYPSRPYISFEGCKSNAHEIIDHRLYEDWQRAYILYKPVISLVRKLKSRKAKRLDRGDVAD